MPKRIKQFTIVMVVVFLGTVFTGCAATYSMEEAKTSSYSVVEVTGPTFTEDRTFSYYDNNGTEHTLPDCGRENFFAQRYCRTTDGDVSFSYSSGKSGLSQTTLTVNGTVHELECALNSDAEGGWSGREICLPVK